MRRQEKLEDYAGFVEKFKPKKTTDDCATPEPVYEAIKGWACAEYGIAPESVVRPFWPGGDYERFDYPDGCTVIDNPPFSIESAIVSFYLEEGIPFFLFCPSLTALSSRAAVMRCCHVFTGIDIAYANGAKVHTSFVTSYDEAVVRTAPELSEAITAAMMDAEPKKRGTMPKYEYPDTVLTAAMCARYAKYGIDYAVSRRDCIPIAKLDAQKASGKSIYGGGLLLSEHAAAEHAAAEHAAAEHAAAKVWQLSEREKKLVGMLGDD